MQKNQIENSKLVTILNKIDILFFWVKLFYPKSKGIENYRLLYFLFFQKILRINGKATWPVHFTSRVLYTKRIKVGNNSSPGRNSGCYIQGRGGIFIGHNLRMGPNVGIISSNHDPDDYDKWIDAGPIEIGDNVWIGMNSVVLPGVKIGNNVVIGANSTVTKNIPSNSIAFGSPCKVVNTKSTYNGKDYSDI